MLRTYITRMRLRSLGFKTMGFRDGGNEKIYNIIDLRHPDENTVATMGQGPYNDIEIVGKSKDLSSHTELKEFCVKFGIYIK